MKKAKEKPRERGYLTYEVLKERTNLPSEKRLREKPVVVVECTEEIPCDPCTAVCDFGAIQKDTLTKPPKVDYEKCTGCTECIAHCPGLAIFVVYKGYEEDRSLIFLPYELSPVPDKGETVRVLNRSGEDIGKGEVVNVREGARGTMVIGVATDKDFAMKARAIKTMR